MPAHEREHVRAGDTKLLLAGHAAVVALPWSVPLWLVVRRLSDAIEIDAIGVLRHEYDLAAYGMLLLASGGGPIAGPVTSR